MTTDLPYLNAVEYTHLTPRRLISIWWAFWWRATLWSFIGSFIWSLAWTPSWKTENTDLLGLITGIYLLGLLIITFGASISAMRTALTRRYADFTLSIKH